MGGKTKRNIPVEKENRPFYRLISIHCNSVGDTGVEKQFSFFLNITELFHSGTLTKTSARGKPGIKSTKTGREHRIQQAASQKACGCKERKLRVTESQLQDSMPYASSGSNALPAIPQTGQT